MSEDPVVIVDYDQGWPAEFRSLAAPIRGALGDVALRIDHVGSTAVPGMAAKPVIDIQVSVRTLNPEEPFLLPLTSLGYRLRRENPDLTKRFFREPLGARRVHVHVRPQGSFDEQLNLLLRDFLRTHERDATAYALRKRELAPKFRDDREGYVHAKEPTIWELLLNAHDWAQESGWAAGRSDA